MNIIPIRTEEDYQKAIKRLQDIFDAAPNTLDGDELEILGALIDNFEKTHFPIDPTQKY